jgi:hypothetical protein
MSNSYSIIPNTMVGETWKIAYRDWKPSITMERGTWNNTGMPSAMPLSSFESKLFKFSDENEYATKVPRSIVILGFQSL